jgi:lysophospholipase L1-like esterase
LSGARIPAAVLGALALLGGASAIAAPRGVWLEAWQATFQHAGPQAPATISGQSVNAPVRLALGGDGLRVRLTNELGSDPVTLGAGSVTLPGGKTLPLTFGGLAAITLPPGAPVLSDPVDAKVAALDTVTVTVSFPAPFTPQTLEREPAPTAQLVAAGAPAAPYPNILVSGVEVRSAARHPVMVVFGDTKSAGPGTWPDFLVPRAAKAGIGVTNPSMFAGLIALGPRDQSGLARFDRDVLSAAGATHVIISQGNNDIIQPGAQGSNGKVMIDPSLAFSAPQLIAIYRQLIDRAHAHGLKAVGTTLLPYEGVAIPGYASPEHLAKRDAINAWIRTGGAFDAVIDFDKALRDPTHPQRLSPGFDSGNHFTPNAAGYKAMADAVDLALFK